MSKSLVRVIALVVLSLPMTLFAAARTHEVTPMEPGQWSMHEHGVVQVMGMNRPFARTRQVCVHPGEKHNPGVPQGHGRCRTRQTAGKGGEMHWTMDCKAGDVVMHGTGTVHASRRHFISRSRMVGKNPAQPQYATTTTITIEGRWLGPKCGP